MPRLVFDTASAMVMGWLVSTVPHQKSSREAKRRTSLTTALNHLTQASWVIDCWQRKINEDTRVLCNMELAMGSILPFTTRGLILEFTCGNLDSLYGCVCRVKSNSYHILEKPMFWHPQRDWVIPNDKSNARSILIGVYSHVLERYHKPKIRRLKRVIDVHSKFVDKNPWMQNRSKGCRRLLHLLESMLGQQVEIIASPPF